MNKKTKKGIERYNHVWPVTHPFWLELAAYSRESVRERIGQNTEPYFHLRNAIMEAFPDISKDGKVGWGVFRWNRWVEAVMEEMCQHRSYSLGGCAAAGKSGPVGMWALMDALAEPKTTTTMMITNPNEKHGERCWGSMAKFYNQLPKEFQLGQMLASPLSLQFVRASEGYRAGIFTMVAEKHLSWEELGKYIGTHNERLRIIVDEADECSPSCLDIMSNMGASGDYRETFLNNPSSNTKPFGKHATPADQDWQRIFDEEPDTWLTANEIRGEQGRARILNGLKAPSLDSKEEAERLHFLIQPHFIEDMRKRGTDSPFWYKYVKGTFMPGSIDGLVLSQKDVDHFQAEKRVRGWITNPQTYATLDPATKGKDACPLYPYNIGESVDRGLILEFGDPEYITIELKKGDLTGQVARQVIDNLVQWGITPNELAADATGQQGGLLDRIEREFQLRFGGGPYRCYRVYSEGGASDRNISRYGELAKQRYANRATEILMNFTELAECGRIAGMSKKMVRDLTTRKLEDEDDSRTIVEKKKLWRERNDRKSPDDGDCGAIAATRAVEQKQVPSEMVLPKNAAELIAEEIQKRHKKTKKKRTNRMNRVRNLQKKWPR